jgi:hypothetical protein
LALEALEGTTPTVLSESDDRPLVNLASEMWQNVPQSEWNEVPADFAQNYRAYRKSSHFSQAGFRLLL